MSQLSSAACSPSNTHEVVDVGQLSAVRCCREFPVQKSFDFSPVQKSFDFILGEGVRCHVVWIAKITHSVTLIFDFMISDNLASPRC